MSSLAWSRHDVVPKDLDTLMLTVQSHSRFPRFQGIRIHVPAYISQTVTERVSLRYGGTSECTPSFSFLFLPPSHAVSGEIPTEINKYILTKNNKVSFQVLRYRALILKAFSGTDAMVWMVHLRQFLWE